MMNGINITEEAAIAKAKAKIALWRSYRKIANGNAGATQWLVS